MCTLLAMTQCLPPGSGQSTLQGPPCQHTDEVAPLLNSTAHITDRSGRRLRGSSGLVDSCLRNGLASEGSSRLFDEQWCGCDGTQGNACIGHGGPVIAEDDGRPDANDSDVHLITRDEAQIVGPEMARRRRDTEGH